MFADFDGLRAGAQNSRDAGSHAHQGAAHLDNASVGSDIFGSFSEASDFQAAVSGAKSRHGRKLTGHGKALHGFGGLADGTAAALSDTDEDNAAKLGQF